MIKTLTLTTALSLSMAVGCYSALAQNAPSSPPMSSKQNTTSGKVDVSNLVGRNIVNSSGETVGEIESVLVNDSGVVDSVVVDVSGWLQSEKLISVAWKDLTVSPDGKTITSSKLTKEMGTSTPAYKYSDESWRGKVMTRSGTPYSRASASAMPSFGTPVMNADGSLNLSQIIGLDILGSQNEKIGDIDDLLIAKDGHIESVIIDVGGFLGVGARPVRLSWKDLAWSGQGDKAKATVNYTKDRLEKLPEYRASAVR